MAIWKATFKVFTIRTQFGRVLNTFMYFWNAGCFLKTNSTVFDQAFHGAFLQLFSLQLTCSYCLASRPKSFQLPQILCVKPLSADPCSDLVYQLINYVKSVDLLTIKLSKYCTSQYYIDVYNSSGQLVLYATKPITSITGFVNIFKKAYPKFIYLG